MTQPPLPYESPAPARHVGGWFDWRTFARSGLILGAWLAVMLLAVPRIEQTLADYRAELPGWSQTLFAVQHAIVGGWWVAVLLIPPGLGFAVAPFGPAGRRIARLIIVLGLGLLTVLTVLGVFLPITGLMENLTKVK